MEGFNFYRIKTDWTSEREDGGLEKVKTEELVYASCYTEAEKIANHLIEKYDRTHFGSAVYEIIKTKIGEILYSDTLKTDKETVGGLLCSYFEEAEDSGAGMYQVKVLYTEIDERTAKKKRTTEVIFTPAVSNSNANEIVLAYLKKIGELRDYVIRDAKFDKAEAILWPAEIYQNKVNQMA